MNLDFPALTPPSGDYRTRISKGYGNPHGSIILDETNRLELEHISAEDCDRIIRAAAEIKTGILAYREKMAAPHGRDHFYKGECQLCGKPEDDELHAELVALKQEMDPPVTGCAEVDDGYICNGHEDGHHVVYGPDGEVCHRWPVAAPVITDSERDCPALNPEGGWPCHKSGAHKTHRDSNGGTWTTGAPVAQVCDCGSGKVVPPGALAAGYGCRDCLSDQTTEALARYDHAARTAPASVTA